RQQVTAAKVGVADQLERSIAGDEPAAREPVEQVAGAGANDPVHLRSRRHPVRGCDGDSHRMLLWKFIDQRGQRFSDRAPIGRRGGARGGGGGARRLKAPRGAKVGQGGAREQQPQRGVGKPLFVKLAEMRVALPGPRQQRVAKVIERRPVLRRREGAISGAREISRVHLSAEEALRERRAGRPAAMPKQNLLRRATFEFVIPAKAGDQGTRWSYCPGFPLSRE